MNAEGVKRLLSQTPFDALEVTLSSGQTYTIKHPECAMVLKNTLVIGDPENDFVNWCSLIHITNIRRKGELLPA